jgi:hypothetical protein
MDDGFVIAATYSDRLSAEAARGLLADADLPCYLASDAHVPGIGTSFSVCVPRRHLERARAALAQEPVTDQELTALALAMPRAEATEP